jgi:hypothetical protein
MTKIEIRKVIATIAAAYPSWHAAEETFALYESILMPLSLDSVQQVVMNFIRLPGEFARPVGAIYSRALELDMRKRAIEADRRRRHEPGTVAYTPTGQRIQAGEDGLMRAVPEPEPKPVDNEFTRESGWLARLIEKSNAPRAVVRRAIGSFRKEPEPVNLTRLLSENVVKVLRFVGSNAGADDEYNQSLRD